MCAPLSDRVGGNPPREYSRNPECVHRCNPPARRRWEPLERGSYFRPRFALTGSREEPSLRMSLSKEKGGPMPRCVVPLLNVAVVCGELSMLSAGEPPTKETLWVARTVRGIRRLMAQ